MENPKIELAKKYIDYTSVNIFLTGKAGTGKTTFLRDVVANSSKRLIVVAPTGVAAINAGGVTIHSFFQLPFGVCLPNYNHNQAFSPTTRYKFNNVKKKIIRSLDLLIIDEVSMLRADALDEIDNVLRRVRRSDLPFGGVQLLLIGDMQQLPPVVKNDEWEILKDYYNSPYFFESLALKKSEYMTIELDHIYRQSDAEFIELLSQVRENRVTKDTLEMLNSRFQSDFLEKKEEGVIVLTTHNNISSRINENRLRELKEKEFCFEAEIKDNFPEYMYPQDPTLVLKKGSQVMFTKNDPKPEKMYVNGTLGVVTYISDDEIEVTTDRGDVLNVEIAFWENLKYEINNQTKEIVSIIDGFFYQYPLRLAWAITIHKSQGLTFDKVAIDARNAFSHGQVYVALSRCRSLEGIRLNSKITFSSIITDDKIDDFNHENENRAPSEDSLQGDCKRFYLDTLIDVFDVSQVAKWYYMFLKFINVGAVDIYPKVVKQWGDVREPFAKDFVDVARVFQRSLFKLVGDDYLQNDFLQERIKKAAAYFENWIESNLLSLISASKSWDFDAKDVEKIYKNYFQEFVSAVFVRYFAIKNLQDGFVLDDFLKSKSGLMLDTIQLTHSQILKRLLPNTPKGDAVLKGTEEPLEDIKDQELFEKLKKWRSEKAKELSIPAYCILHQKPLIKIANSHPRDGKELLAIKGVGATFMEKYGAEVLDIVGYFE